MINAITDLHCIASYLGGDVHGDYVLAPGPGHSRADRSLKVWLCADARDGFRVHSFAGDDWKECRDYVRQVLYGHEPVAVGFRNPPSQSRTLASELNAHMAMQLWAEARDPRGTIVERYLEKRGLALPDALALRVVRYHPALWLNGKLVPGMITLFRDILTDEPMGIQRTFLNGDATKITRMMLGPCSNAAIKFETDPRGDQFHVGEGFESALAAYLSGRCKVWAMGSAGALGRVPVLNGVLVLTVLGENDKPNADAVRALAKAWCDAGRKVFILMPLHGDIADAYNEAA